MGAPWPAPASWFVSPACPFARGLTGNHRGTRQNVVIDGQVGSILTTTCSRSRPGRRHRYKRFPSSQPDTGASGGPRSGMVPGPGPDGGESPRVTGYPLPRPAAGQHPACAINVPLIPDQPRSTAVGVNGNPARPQIEASGAQWGAAFQAGGAGSISAVTQLRRQTKIRPSPGRQRSGRDENRRELPRRISTVHSLFSR